ncbi:MAG: hypothetical protein C0501_06225 [Isosphaera sp.]|nr:hypothetical protein [Isosphaera sp.]
MEFTDRYFGRVGRQPGGPPVANPRLPHPPAFRVLFPAPPDLDAAALTAALRGYAAELADATAEVQALPPSPGGPSVLGLIAWGRHVVKLAGYGYPMPAAEVETCVRPALFVEPDEKEAAYRHGAHASLFYAGYDADVLEQHVALAAAAAALAKAGAVAVLNETAHTSVPATGLLPHDEDAGDTMGALRRFPLPYLYAGFVQMTVEDEPGVWMRTRGCEMFGLPDLAVRAAGHAQTGAVFGLFRGVLADLRESGRRLDPGDTLAVGDGMYFRTRSAAEDEWYLDSPGRLVVLEPIPEGEKP